MKNTEYAQTYSSMSDGELARLVSQGRDSLTEQAAKALDEELKMRGLNDDLLAHEYPTAKPTSSDQHNAPQFPPRQELVEDVRKLRSWQVMVVVLTFVSALTFIMLRQREAKQDELYEKVVTNLGNPESHSAFNELITYRGAHARQLILKIARDESGLFDTMPTDAIRVLGQTGDSETADRLALLVRPWRGLAVRAAAADSLLKLPCSPECVHSLLDYKERKWRGDLSVETILDTDIPNETREKENEIDQKLDRLLLNNRRDTLRILIEIYGLGEIEVSPFALHLIRELKLTEACRLMKADKSFPVPGERTLFPRLAEAQEQINATRQQVCGGSSLITP
jgi:hypothetical protein